jgi:hypothetical protein
LRGLSGLHCDMLRRPKSGKSSKEGCVMHTCRECNNEVEELKMVKVGGKRKKMCEDCADRAAQEGAVAEESEAVVQQMMGFKGRR